MTDTKPTSATNRAYSAATTALRDKHRDEFELLLAAEYQKAGIARKPRRTPEQVAADKAHTAEMKAAEKRAIAREKALAAAMALAAEYPDILAIVPQDDSGHVSAF